MRRHALAHKRQPVALSGGGDVFVDEGKRGGYLLCAAVVPSADIAAARAAMRPLKPGNRRRLHMHSEGVVRRQQILARFAATPPITVAITPQRDGRVIIDGADVSFRSGIRQGTQHVGGTIGVTTG